VNAAVSPAKTDTSAREEILMFKGRQFARRLFGRPTDVTMSIAKFESLEKVDLKARAVDVSSGGLCIESASPLEPGFVWFRDGLETEKGGVVVWSRELDDKTCRAGIQFVPVKQDEECSGNTGTAELPVPSWSDPGLVVSMLVDEHAPEKN